MSRSSLVPVTTPLYTSLPASPVDGQIIDYQADAANGIVWRLRYNAASSSPYKWEFVSGSALYAKNESIAAMGGTGSSYSEPSGSSGPDITCPLAGDYDVNFGACVQHASTMINISFGICLGVTAQASLVAPTATLAGGGAWNPTWTQDRITVVSPGTVLRMRYQYSSIAWSVGYRRMSVQPLRVG